MFLYDFELERITKIIKEGNFKLVGLQFPEGLKEHALTVGERIRTRAECEVFISGNSCYGACDVADAEMAGLGCEALFHFGHAQLLSKTEIPVFYIEARSSIDPVPLISKHLDRLKGKVGLVATVQHVHYLEKVRDFLEGRGFPVLIGKARGRVEYNGQLLGCNFATAEDISAEVNSFLYIGSGNFHPLGVALATGKKTLAFDIQMDEVRDMDELKEKILRQRFAQIVKATNAESFGVIVGEKKGQRRKGLALKIKEKLEKRNKHVYLISLREISPENLLPFRKIDAFVNTACPRVTIDDAARYKHALLTPIELEILLGERRFEDYKMDEIYFR